MAQYINKDALMADIEKLIDKGEYHEGYDCGYRDGTNDTLDALKEKINTLEVKEVDFEKELDRIWFDNKFGDMFDNSAVDFANVREICRHFFELGLKVNQKLKTDKND